MWSKGLVIAVLNVAASAAPTTLDTRQYEGGCTDEAGYTVAAEATRWTPVYVADGLACTSSTTEGCTVGAQYSKSFSVSIEVGGSVDVSEVFSVDSSITYTTTTTTGYTEGQTCPAGSPAYICGLTYTNRVVDVIGTKTLYYQGDCALHGQVESSSPFQFTAPVMIGDTAQVIYAACISARSPNQDTGAVGIPSCPDGV